jgi:hypothetical protein
MASKSMIKNTQLLVAGLVAAATLGLVYYLATSSSTESASSSSSSKKKKLLDEDDGANDKQRGSRSVDFSSDSTPKKSNESIPEEKQMHAKIEELDKKGKALFKNKQVRKRIFFKQKYCLFVHTLE